VAIAAEPSQASVALLALHPCGRVTFRTPGRPMLLSTNPIGSVADHMAMHITAVTHTYETDVRLLPPTEAR
jgi:hypothetical protein